MKIKKGFNLRRVGDENVIVAQGIENINFNRIISLNDTAAYLWKEIENKTFTPEMLVSLLTDRYEIDSETAARDVKELVQSWIKAEIINE